MKIIKLFFQLLKTLLVSPVSLLKNIMQFLIVNEKQKEVASYGFDKGFPTVDITQIVGQLDVTINNFTFLDLTSRLTDIALLKLLAKKFDRCDYLEIGSWRGESIINVDENAGESSSLSLSQDEMKAMGYSEAIVKTEGYFLRNNNRIKIFKENSRSFDFSKLGKKFDLIFVDGDHKYDGVVSDTINVFKLLKNEKSIIVWHDCGNSYEDVRWEVQAAILKAVPPEKRKYLYRVSNSLCGIFIQENLKAEFKEPYGAPNKTFKVHIKSDPIE